MSDRGVDITKHLASLDAALDRVLDAATVAVGKFAEEVVLSKAVELCPVSPSDPNHPLYIGTSGDLARSGTQVGPERDGVYVYTVVGFNTDYAFFVHEDLEANHQYPGAINSQAQAKFLSAAMEYGGQKFALAMSYYMREVLG